MIDHIHCIICQIVCKQNNVIRPHFFIYLHPLQYPLSRKLSVCYFGTNPYRSVWLHKGIVNIHELQTIFFANGRYRQCYAVRFVTRPGNCSVTDELHCSDHSRIPQTPCIDLGNFCKLHLPMRIKTAVILPVDSLAQDGLPTINDYPVPECTSRRIWRNGSQVVHVQIIDTSYNWMVINVVLIINSLLPSRLLFIITSLFIIVFSFRGWLWWHFLILWFLGFIFWLIELYVDVCLIFRVLKKKRRDM